MVSSGLNDRGLDCSLVVMVVAVMGTVFSTGRSFGRMHQSLMSHQQVTVDPRYQQLGESIGGWGEGQKKQRNPQETSWTYLRAKDLEQMSHEKGFSLVSVVRR